mgnify:CR=1 FL=1
MMDKKGKGNEDEEFQWQIIHNYMDLMVEKIVAGEVGVILTLDNIDDIFSIRLPRS